MFRNPEKFFLSKTVRKILKFPERPIKVNPFFKINISDVKGLLLSRGICGLTHLEQTFANIEKGEELINAAEQHILSGT